MIILGWVRVSLVTLPRLLLMVKVGCSSFARGRRDGIHGHITGLMAIICNVTNVVRILQ